MDRKPPFERVVAEHATTVLRVCRAVLGTHADADDAWSETFLAALRAYPELPETANLQAWLVTIAHRKAIDVIRIRQRQAHTMAVLPERASELGNPGEYLELWEAVRSLPDKQRLCVAYHYLGGLPYGQVAELIGGSAEAARRAASDGIAALRMRFAGGSEVEEGATR